MKANQPGPLQSYKMKDHCEMCGITDAACRNHDDSAAHLEPAFNPSGQLMTLCRDCRIGSAEILAAERANGRAIITVYGGVAEVGESSVPVDIIDYDNLKELCAAEFNHAWLSKDAKRYLLRESADLAKKLGITEKETQD